MPSTRWLFVAAFAICWSQVRLAKNTDRSDQLPVASNGWRPIVGHDVKPYEPYIGEQTGPNLQTSATNHPKPPKQNVPQNAENKQGVKKDDKKPPASQHMKNQGHVATGSKSQPNHIHVSHHGSTGHRGKYNVQPKPVYKPTTHIISHMVPTGKPHRHPVSTKFHAHVTGKRHKPKPVRTQHTAHSTRDEVIALAPSSAIGSYTYFNQGPLNKPYLSQSHHLDFTNHFALPNDHSHIHSQFQLPKQPAANELHNNFYYFNQNDDYTRNLVPPPYKTLTDNKQAEPTKHESINDPQLIIGKQKDGVGNILPENLVVQLPPTFNTNSFANDKPTLEFEITKENLKEYHSTVSPLKYSPSTESYAELPKFTRAKDVLVSSQGYQVTEGKHWQDQHQNDNLPPAFKLFPTVATNLQTHPTYKTVFSTNIPDHKYQQDSVQDYENKYHSSGNVFLPTPFNPDGHFNAESAFPTSPTQAEVSTVYSEVTQLNKNKQVYQLSPVKYNIKDVATHFPIYEQRRPELETPQPTQNDVTTQFEDNEPTTLEEARPTAARPTLPTSTTVRGNPVRTRTNQRRRRPTRPTEAPTEAHHEYKAQEDEKPTRRRRPIKYRTTEPPEAAETTKVSFRKPTRFPQTVTEETFDATYGKTPSKQQKYVDDNEETTSKHYLNYAHVEVQEVQEPEAQTTEATRPRTKPKRKRVRPTSVPETTPYTNLKLPENEPEIVTVPDVEQVTDEVYSLIPEQESTTTLATTTSTTEEPTTKSHRIRRPLNKYNTNRPRFSVKEYRDRIAQYISTTSTELPKPITDAPKLRFPNRFKVSTSTDEQEESTEPIRPKFIPKDPRHRPLTTESPVEISTEKHVRTINTRLRPFGKQRTTTEPTTTTQRVTVKPKIFSTLKRPQPLSLRNRILGKKNVTTTTEVAPTEMFTEPVTEDATLSERMEVTVPYEETTTETKRSRKKPAFKPNEINEHEDVMAPEEAETFLQLQRISDLTSSAKKEYNTPGMFKSVSPISRRIPSYFTIATEDPILPIEAFFPNLNHKNDKHI